MAQFFAGSVSEISVYDRILSTADIETLYDISEEPTYILGTKSYCTNGPVTTGITENRAIQIPVSYEGELAASGFGFEADRNSGILLSLASLLIFAGILTNRKENYTPSA